MPKERRHHSMSHDRYRVSPFPCSSSHTRQSSPKFPLETQDNVEEWDAARCPVCMEHPHNAVLLICSSHEKGCHPYMCDTSRRHSNCLDLFRKSFSETSSYIPVQDDSLSLFSTDSISTEASETTITDMQEGRSEDLPLTTHHPISPEKQSNPKLSCPLCRGLIKNWIVDKPARLFMNAKQRNCSCETCNFNGTYKDLRKHARKEHPSVCPSEADPERERNWRRLERQRDLEDLLSTLQSSFGVDREEDNILPIDDERRLTVFFLIRAFRPESRPRSSRRSSVAYAARALPRVRRRWSRLWDENYDGEIGPSSARDDNIEPSGDDLSPWTHHERIVRGTSPDDLP